MGGTHSSPGTTFPPMLTEAGGDESLNPVCGVKIQTTFHPVQIVQPAE